MVYVKNKKDTALFGCVQKGITTKRWENPFAAPFIPHRMGFLFNHGRSPGSISSY